MLEKVNLETWRCSSNRVDNLTLGLESYSLCLIFGVFNLCVTFGGGGGLVAKSCPTLAIPLACQAPLPMGFSRQEYWSGLPFPSPGDLPYPGIEPKSPALQADNLPTEL